MLRTTLLSIMVWAGLLIDQTQAQFTIPVLLAPATKLESFETNTSVVILKATTDLGAVPAKNGSIEVMCREATDTSTGRKEQGIAVVITQKGQPAETLFIDYDEIASLSAAVKYLSEILVTVTPLNTFDAAYTTKGGFRIAALGNRLTGVVQFGARDARNRSTPVVFSAVEMSRLAALIDQAKTTLDAVRGG
jgi:hypothetical protein